MTEPTPLITNKQLQTLLSRAKGMSKDNRDTMWEALVFVRGTYERERAARWQPVNPVGMVNGEYDDADIKLCYRRKAEEPNAD
jgi:hypothetical protein